MKTGDIILFKGNGAFSALITALPGADYSHVGMYVNHPEFGACMFESTSLGTLPDLITGEPICGVQLVPFQKRVDSYDGDVFLRPIIGTRTAATWRVVLDFIDEFHGTPYEEDNLQLVRAELDLFPWQKNEPDPSSLFCSETVIKCLRSACIIKDDGQPPNEFTPTDCATDAIKLRQNASDDGFFFGDITTLKPEEDDDSQKWVPFTDESGS